MHELSVALSIVEIAEKEALKANAGCVKSIELDIGSLAGIEMDSFDFVWPIAVKGTLLEHAKRIINKIEARAVCLECGTEFSLGALHDGCPECNSYFKDIVRGREMRVKSLEVE